MGATAVYSLPFQGLTDPPDGPNLGEDLALAIEAVLQGNLALGGNLTVPGNLTVAGNLAVTGNLTVTGVGNRQFVRKTVDESVSSATTGTTFQDDDHLFFSVPANATTTFGLVLYGVGGNNAGDLNLRFSFPANATLTWGPFGLNNGVTGGSSGSLETQAIYQTTVSPTGSTPVALSAVPNIIKIEGIIRTGVTPGTVRLQWAQLASNAAASTLKADSFLVAIREA
jgi:hypothetical protein